MKSQFRIGFLLIALLLANSVSGKTNAVLLRVAPEIEQSQEQPPPAALPGPESSVSFPPPGEGGFNILEQLPHSNAAEHTRHHGNRCGAAEHKAERIAKIRLRILPAVYHGLVVKEIIFPFHSHL